MSRRKEMIEIAAALGFEARHAKNGHLRLEHPSGVVSHAAASPSSSRTRINTQARLRRELARHGVEVERPAKAEAKPKAPRSKPHPAGLFRLVATGVLAGNVDGRPAHLELFPGPRGEERWRFRWRANGAAPPADEVAALLARARAEAFAQGRAAALAEVEPKAPQPATPPRRPRLPGWRADRYRRWLERELVRPGAMQKACAALRLEPRHVSFLLSGRCELSSAQKEKLWLALGQPPVPPPGRSRS